jgi:hypothetical protein
MSVRGMIASNDGRLVVVVKDCRWLFRVELKNLSMMGDLMWTNDNGHQDDTVHCQDTGHYPVRQSIIGP